MKLAIINTDVVTCDPEKPRATALLIENGRIAKVGGNDEIRMAAGTDCEILEMPGRLVTPGLTDAHVHFLKFGQAFKRVDLHGLLSIEDCREKVRDAVRHAAPGEWIVGYGWNHHAWKESREPDRADLDDIAPDNPVMLYRMCIHSVWLNSRALQIAGITSRTPNPPGGRVEKDPATGEPTGVIRETYDNIETCIPEPDREALLAAGLVAQKEAFRRGVTSVHSLESLTEWDIWKQLDEEGLLKIRIHHTLPPEELHPALQKGIRPNTGSDRLWFGGMKLFADGSLGSGTAYLYDEYSDEPGNVGLEFTPVETLVENIADAYRNGCDVAVHAIGDKAVTNALKAFETARANYPDGHRDRIEHSQLFREDDLAAFKNLGLVASVQPVHLATDWSIAEKRWGGERCCRAYAYKSLANAGIPVQFGSDAPVEPIDPILSLRAAVLRQDLQCHPEQGWYPGECFSLEDSLKAFTAMPAWSARKEDVLGSITPDKWADLTIFEKNLFDVSSRDWHTVDIEMTIVGGEIVHRKP